MRGRTITASDSEKEDAGSWGRISGKDGGSQGFSFKGGKARKGKKQLSMIHLSNATTAYEEKSEGGGGGGGGSMLGWTREEGEKNRSPC